jgi:hypothetical protein
MGSGGIGEGFSRDEREFWSWVLDWMDGDGIS